METDIRQETIVLNQRLTAYKSKWGWHPLPYSSYKKLKQLYKWAFEAYKKHCKLYSWAKKTVNRSDEEPEIDTRFTNVIPYDPYKRRIKMPMIHYLTVDGKKIIKTIYKDIFEPEALYTIYAHVSMIIHSFIECRYPQEEPEDVKRTDLDIKEIDELYAMIIEEKEEWKNFKIRSFYEY